MWLKLLAKKDQISPKILAEYAQIAETTAKSWLLVGIIPRTKYWNRIAHFLGMKFEEVSFLYMNQLEEENRIKECIVCKKHIILWKPHIKLCNSKSCRMQYDRDRKREERQAHRCQYYVPNRNKFLGYIPETNVNKMSSKVNREDINIAMKEYLSKGGTITRLDEGIAEGSDQFSLDLVKQGIDLVEME